MVRNLHAAGIEVILDVVYNHTAEGNQLGPTLSSVGSTTRRLSAFAAKIPLLHGFHGCGIVSNAESARAAIDYGIVCDIPWIVAHGHVDGFPLSTWRARWPASYTRWTSWGVFDIIHQDPVSRR